MNSRIKQEKYTSGNGPMGIVKEEVVPIIIHQDANTFATYTLQTFADDDDAAAVATLTNQQHRNNGVTLRQIIHGEEVDDEDDDEDDDENNQEESQQLQHNEEEEQDFDQQQQQQLIHIQEISSVTSNLSGFKTEPFMTPEPSRSKTFYCPNCGNCYSAAGSLKLHIRACMRSKDEQPAQDNNRKCEICNKMFNSSAYLKEHMLRHTGKGPRKCLKCYRKFVDDDKYEAHMETHKLQEKLGLEEATASSSSGGNGNGGSGGSSQAAKKVVKEYVCSFCSKKFTVIFDSRQTKRRYACDDCREKYSNEEMLKQHKAAMEEKREFHCEKCGRKFIFEGFLQRHLPNCDGTIKRRRDRT